MSRPLDHALPLIRAGVHVLVAVLLAVAALAAVGEDDGTGVAAAAGFAVVYALGLWPRIAGDRRLLVVWGALLTVAWVLLVLQTAAGVWLAFPLFFLAAHLLGTRVAAAVVAGLTAIAIGGFAWHRGELNVGGVLGPILGAIVAVGTVAGLRAVHALAGERGRLEERDRVARELHDTVAQGLNSIHLLLGAAQAHLDADQPRLAPARDLVAQAHAVAADNLEEARRLVRALAPADLDTRSLPEALARVAGRHSDVAWSVSGDPVPLPGGVDVALLRIAQEAVGNAVRHAGAGRIAMTLSYLPDAVILDVVDDGNGEVSEVGGFGLTTMRQRAEEVGGTLVVEAEPGAGSAIAATVPLAPGPTAGGGAR